MQTFISTALIGLFLLSGSDAEVAEATKGVQVPAYETHTVLMTGYNAVPGQTDGDPTVTASGARSNPDVVAARSRDLAETLPYGTVIEIVRTKDMNTNCGLPVVEEHLGYRVLADTMHKRKTNQIDIMLPAEKTVDLGTKKVNPAVALGVCEDVEIRVVGKVDIKEIPKTQTELKKVVEEQKLAIKKW